VSVPHNGAGNLCALIRHGDDLTLNEVILASDARPVLGTGDNPVVCCDSNATLFYCVYLNNLGIRVISFNTSGVIQIARQLINLGDSASSINGLWCTNSSIAENRFVVNYTRTAVNGMFHEIFNLTTLVTLTLGATYPAIPSGGDNGLGPVVCGCAANGKVWMTYLNGNGQTTVVIRSITAPDIGTRIYRFDGANRGTSSLEFVFPTFYIQHQPVLFNGRVIMTLCVEPANGISAPYGTAGSTGNPGANGCTWITLDFTDVVTAHVAGVDNGTRLTPTVLASGPTEGTAEAWNPFAATLDTNSIYSGGVYSQPGKYIEFPSVDWQEFSAGTQNYTDVTVTQGAIGMNRLSWLEPQYAHLGETTVFAGSVPHAIARGNCFDLGFPQIRPIVKTTTHNAGALPIGSYTLKVVWRWTDEAGQVHRSEPSIAHTQTNGAGAQQISVEFDFPQIGEKIKDRLWAEVYSTDVNLPDTSPFYLQASYQYGTIPSWSHDILAAIDTRGTVLYTDGNTLANQFAHADGGVVSVGKRCWVSDGVAVYGSKLHQFGKGPEFYVDGALTVDIPPAAGRVIGLSSISDRVIIFCERGVYATTGDGPDNVGIGQDFLTAERLSDIGCSGQRAIARTPQGIFFGASYSRGMLDGASASKGTVGNLHMLNTSLEVTYANQRIQAQLTTGIADICYVPEREWLIVQQDRPENDADIYVLDLRSNNFSNWVIDINDMGTIGDNAFWCCAKGYLYTMKSEPLVFSGAPGQDIDSDSGGNSYSMVMDIRGITPGPSKDMLGWGRVRQIKVLGTGNASHGLDSTALLDEAETITWPTVTLPAAPVTTRPTSRYAPEFRFSTQKCSKFDIVLSASPAYPTWTALEVQFRPYTRAIAQSRS
jgi:hypothetical protein